MARFDNGWIKLHRKAVLGDIGSNFTRSGLFTALVAIANIQDSTVEWNGTPRKLERGELVTSLGELADLGGCDRKTVSKHLNYLSLRKTIKLEKSFGGLFIKFLNFEQYQGLDAEGSEVRPKGVDSGIPNAWTHIEEGKNKRKKEIESHVFWNAYRNLVAEYPIKVSASEVGFQRYLEHVKTEADIAIVSAHLANYKTHLRLNKWKVPKQSMETFFGTKKSGYYWKQFETADVGVANSSATPAAPVPLRAIQLDEQAERWAGYIVNAYKQWNRSAINHLADLPDDLLIDLEVAWGSIASFELEQSVRQIRELVYAFRKSHPSIQGAS